MLNDNHVLESIPAYVLGSLEEDEERLVAAHLEGCYACRKELESYQTVADELLLVSPVAGPPADLKPRLLERVERLEKKRRPQPAGWQVPGRLVPVGAAAGLFLIILLAVSNLMLWNRVMQAQGVMTGPLGMRAIALANTDEAPGASGVVIVSADGLNGVLVVDELQPLDETQEYQVWLERDSTETSAAVFAVDEDGYRGVRLTAPESLLNYSSVKVTIEPVGGSAYATGPQVLNGSLSNGGKR